MNTGWLLRGEGGSPIDRAQRPAKTPTTVRARSVCTTEFDSIEEEGKPKEMTRPSEQERYGSSKRDVDELKGAVLRALSAGRADRADELISLLVSMQERRPDRLAKSLCDLASRAARVREFAVARRWLDVALARAPDDPIVWAQVADLLGVSSDNDARLACTERMIERFPDHPTALGSRASALRAAGKWDDAIEVLDRLLARHPDDRYARTGRAVVLQRLGRLDDAELDYRDALARFPGDEIAWTGLGRVFRARGQLRRAIGVLTEATVRFPGCRRAHGSLGDALLARGDAVAARRHCAEAVRRGPGDLAAVRALARALMIAGESRAANEEVIWIAGHARALGAPTVARAVIAKELGDLGNAYTQLRTLEQKKCLDANGVIDLALVLMRLGNPAEAEVVASQASNAKPSSMGEWLVEIGRGLMMVRQRSRQAAAEGVLRAALDCPFPEHRARALNGLTLLDLVRGVTRPDRMWPGDATEFAWIAQARAVLSAFALRDGAALVAALASCPSGLWGPSRLRRLGEEVAPIRGEVFDALVEVVLT